MRRLRSNIVIGLGALLGALVKWGGLLMDLLDLPEFGRKWDGFWTKIGVDEFGAWLLAVTVILLVIVNVPWQRIQQRIKQPKPQKALHIAHNDTEIADGPAYWSLSETLSWMAFGEAISARQWGEKVRVEGLYIRPEEETEKFNKAERELFEKLRGKEITALGKKDHSELYEEIHAEYFLSDVECKILHDQIDVSSRNIGVMQRWSGPKWRDVRFKRENVLHLWPQNRKGK